MTSFERFFYSLKFWFNDPKLYDKWPSFETSFDIEEYILVEIKGKKVLMLNCGDCDGPSDISHPICKKCVDFRKKFIENKNKLESNFWSHLILSRIYTKI